MNIPIWIQDIGWGPIIGAVIGIVGMLILEKYKDVKKQKSGIQIIQCCEKLNQNVFDKNSLGPASKIQIKAEEKGPGSRLIDVDHIYVAIYHLRNLSDTVVDRISLRLDNEPESIWFDIKQGEVRLPDWEDLKIKILQESKISNEKGWRYFTIPYLNPYTTTKHEAILELASYLPLDSIKILGGGKGIGFEFNKPCKEIAPWYTKNYVMFCVVIGITIASSLVFMAPYIQLSQFFSVLGLFIDITIAVIAIMIFLKFTLAK